MNNLIICEGSTDYVLLQYYLRKALSWNDSKNQKQIFKYKDEKSRKLEKENDTVTIASSGGVGNISDVLEKAINYNLITSPYDQEGKIDRVIIFTDNDEEITYKKWKTTIKRITEKFAIKEKETEGLYEYIDKSNLNNIMEILLMIIPFEEQGALETFLLKCISVNDSYDKVIIENIDKFVDSVDKDNRYLNHRRLFVKAKFDVYFSIRTPLKQFKQRQDILKGVSWEKYSEINKAFKVFERLECNRSED